MARDLPPVLLVAGSLHLDVMVEASHIPRVDETVAGTAVRYAFGGKGGNQALAAVRMGAKVDMAGMVGTDDFSRDLLAALDKGRVGRTQVLPVEGPSGMSVALSLPDGSYGAVIVSGANLKFRPERVAFPKDCTALLLQNEIPEAVNLYLARRAGSMRIKVIVNAAPMRAMPPELMRLADLLVVNRGEAADLLGVSEQDLDPVAAAVALGKHGPGSVVVTLGAEGVAQWSGTSATRSSGFAVAARASHGAGDAFIGALAAEWARGATFEAAVRFGQAAAALTVAATPDARLRLSEGEVRACLASEGQRR